MVFQLQKVEDQDKKDERTREKARGRNGCGDEHNGR